MTEYSYIALSDLVYQLCEFFLSMSSSMNGLMDKNNRNDHFKHVQLNVCNDVSITDLTRQNKQDQNV